MSTLTSTMTSSEWVSLLITPWRASGNHSCPQRTCGHFDCVCQIYRYRFQTQISSP